METDELGGSVGMRAPWHLWAVGILSTVWNAGGAYDYILTKTRKADYIAQLTPEHLAYLDAFPGWVGAFWALGVWGAVAGSILLLLGSRFAGSAFAVSLLGMTGNLVYGFVLAKVSLVDVAGPFALVFTGVIAVIAVVLWIYARQMTKAAVLR